MRLMRRRSNLPSVIAVTLVAFLLAGWSRHAPAQGYGPPAPPPPPINEDGSIHWGTFYKSASIQQAYERLWNLGACRGTNKRITIPVENNKMQIDSLPEAEFRGIVQAAAGTVAGGLIAFTEAGGVGDTPLTYVAQLHPAGVSGLQVHGPAAATSLAAGMIVRLQAMVDAQGRGVDEVETIEIVTPPRDFEPPTISPGSRSEIVGRITAVRGNGLTMQLLKPAGGLRRVFLPLSADVVVRFDAAQVEYVAAGDQISLAGRLWTGEGSMAAGTIFASDVVITKHP
jgi:hypothetical protein